jgi:hypothetical protein
MKRTIQSGAGALIAAFLMLPLALRAEVACGVDRDTVLKELGYADARTAIGSTEILSYRNGTKVTLEKGVVVEVARKGQITGLKQPYVPAAWVKPPSNAGGGSTPADTRPQPAPAPVQQAIAKPDVSTPKLTPSPAPAITLEDDSNKRTTALSTTSHTRPPPVHHLPRQVSVLRLAGHAPMAAIPVALLLAIAIVALASYIFMCYCLKRICLKAGEDPGVLVWIPIAQMIPLLRIAQFPGFLLLLFLVPIVNWVFTLVLWARVCSALGESRWLTLVLLVPGLNLFLIPYLAFCGGDGEKECLKSAPMSPPLPSQAPPPLPQEALVPTPST